MTLGHSVRLLSFPSARVTATVCLRRGGNEAHSKPCVRGPLCITSCVCVDWLSDSVDLLLRCSLSPEHISLGLSKIGVRRTNSPRPLSVCLQATGYEKDWIGPSGDTYG